MNKESLISRVEIEKEFEVFHDFLRKSNSEICRRTWRDEFRIQGFLEQILWSDVDLENLETIKFLQEINLINWSDQNGQYPIHLACQNGNFDILNRLIELAADVNVKNKYGEYPIHLACEHMNSEILCKLIDSGADVNVKNENGQSLFYFACIKSSTKVIRILLAAGCEIKEGDELTLKVEVDGNIVTLNFDEWIKFDTFGEMKVKIGEKMGRSVINLDLWGENYKGFLGLQKERLEYESEFDCKFNPCYCLLKKMNEYKLENKLNDNLFECRNSITNTNYFAWKVGRNCSIFQVIKMMKLEHENIMKILEIRSNGESPFMITEASEGKLFANYMPQMKLKSEIKYFCGSILDGIQNLIKAEIKIEIGAWICKDLRCLLIPSDFYTDYFMSPDNNRLDIFYSNQFMKILKQDNNSTNIHHRPTSEINHFVNYFCGYVQSITDSKKSNDIIKSLIRSI